MIQVLWKLLQRLEEEGPGRRMKKSGARRKRMTPGSDHATSRRTLARAWESGRNAENKTDKGRSGFVMGYYK